MLKVKEIKEMIDNAIETNDFSVYDVLIKNAKEKMRRSGRPLTIQEFKDLLGIHITVNHTGKMSGMISISTSCLHNPDCKDHAEIDGAICKLCYANTLLTKRSSIDIPLLKNTKILCNVIIPADVWPLLNVRYFRFESFGDLQCANQCINYFNCCERNKDTECALWSKNYKYIKITIDDLGYSKPSNLVIVISSLMLNVRLNIKLFPHADKVFTVYTREFLNEHPEIKINCGSLHCLTCNRCYHLDSEVYINELVRM